MAVRAIVIVVLKARGSRLGRVSRRSLFAACSVAILASCAVYSPDVGSDGAAPTGAGGNTALDGRAGAGAVASDGSGTTGSGGNGGSTGGRGGTGATAGS